VGREREAVIKRFYRSDKSRHTEELGLGLSLVAAIVKLHGFRFAIAAGPGCTVEIACPRGHRIGKRERRTTDVLVRNPHADVGMALGSRSMLT
jgi:signal transduction histidine kinase